MSKKQDMWVITTREIQRNKVVFEDEVTKEEAIKLFMAGEYDDIIDSDILDTEEAWIEEEEEEDEF